MAARRLILAMLVLLVLSSIAAALIPVDRHNLDDSTMPSSTTAAEAATEGRLITRTVSAAAPRRPTIRMHVGDQLSLTVTSPVANMVEIEAFGGLEDVDPNFPAKFDLLTFDAGQFPVRLVDPPGLVATIDVQP